MLVGIVIERMRPAAPCPIRGVMFNLAYLALAAVLQMLIGFGVAAGAISLTNYLGGGAIILPSDGWLLVPAVVAFIIIMDFGEYAFHRAQHFIPALWAMHAFHHSDLAMNISTTSRHFWAEQAIKTMTIYFLIGLLFKVNATVLSSYSLISLCNLFFHMNIRVGLGRGWLLLNSPQYHRVHHSALPEHRDKNFAALLPIFDLLVGAAYRPRADEYPPTGLYDLDHPRRLIEAIIWPARHIFRRLLAGSHYS
jgi:sterol desaturase/sphingolipid hydroxylase (fatty acid hydroxylase superfamily)